MLDDLQISPQWTVTDADIATVAAAYGRTVTASPLHPLGGAVNGVVRVGSNTGDIVVRVNRTWTTPERLTWTHTVQHHLRNHGLPIPHILETRNGGTWTTLHGRLVEVSEYVPGGTQMRTWDQAEAAFATLGRLHAALRQIPTSNVPPPGHSCYADPATALAMLAETEDTFRSYADHAGYPVAAAIRADARGLLLRLAIERSVYDDSLPRSLVHGDYVGNNVLLRGTDVVAIVDFDRAARRERILDIAYVLDSVLNAVGAWNDDGSVPDRGLIGITRLLRLYGDASGFPLTRTEGVALPFEMARMQLYPVVTAGYPFVAHEGRGPIAETTAVAPHLPRAWWLVENAAYVRSVVPTASTLPNGV